MQSSLDDITETEIYRINCASAKEAVIGSSFLITALGLALVLIWNSLTCLQIPLVKSSLPTGRVSPEISASANLVYCLLSSGKTKPKNTRSGFLTSCLDSQNNSVIVSRDNFRYTKARMCFELELFSYKYTSKSLISSNRFLIHLFILYSYILPCCDFRINSYSTHRNLCTGRKANRSYIIFFRSVSCQWSRYLSLTGKLFTLQGKHDRCNLSGFQTFIPWEMTA